MRKTFISIRKIVLLINLLQILDAQLSLFLAKIVIFNKLGSLTGFQQLIIKSILEEYTVNVLMEDMSQIWSSLLMSSTPTATSARPMLPILLRLSSMLNRLTSSLSSWFSGQMCSLANQERYIFIYLGLFDLFWIQ